MNTSMAIKSKNMKFHVIWLGGTNATFALLTNDPRVIRGRLATGRGSSVVVSIIAVWSPWALQSVCRVRGLRPVRCCLAVETPQKSGMEYTWANLDPIGHNAGYRYWLRHRPTRIYVRSISHGDDESTRRSRRFTSVHDFFSECAPLDGDPPKMLCERDQAPVEPLRKSRMCNVGGIGVNSVSNRMFRRFEGRV